MPDLTTTLFSNLNIQTVLVGLIVLLIVQKIRQRFKYKLPPGPFALPLIGNYDVVQAKFTHERFMVYTQKYGPVFQVYIGTLRVVVLNDIKVVTEALITQKADFANRPQSPSLLMMTEGGKDIGVVNYTPIWKLHRQIAGKALRRYMTGNHLQNMLHKSMTKCLKLMAEETDSFDPTKYLDLMVFNTLDGIIFGESAEVNDPEFQLLMKLGRDFTVYFGQVFVEDMLPILLRVGKTAKFRHVENCVNAISEIFRRKLRQHQETFDKEHLRDFTDSLILARLEAEEDESEELLSQLTETHLIQTLMDIFFGSLSRYCTREPLVTMACFYYGPKAPFPQRHNAAFEITEMTMSLRFSECAGIDALGITMCYAMWYMGKLPDIQSNVQDEIDKIVGKDAFPALKDREKLQYTEATLHEIMRLDPVFAVGFPHATCCDTTVGGYDIPKDTMVIINHYALHHDPNYWKDAKTFDPTRYLDENGKLAMKPESWLPFSLGLRGCLGESVAKPQLHLMLSCILQRFNISLAPDTSPEIAYDGTSTLRTPVSFKIKVKERK